MRVIHNSKFRIHNYDYYFNSEFIIMTTIVGKIFNWKIQRLKHKSKSSKFNVQSSKDNWGNS